MSYKKNTIRFEIHKAKEISMVDSKQSITWDILDAFMKKGFGNEYRGYEYLVKRNLDRNNSIICGLTLENKLIAVSFIRPSGKKDGTVVDPDYRRKGIGRNLIKYSLKHFPNQFCVIGLINVAAINLLLSCGFQYVKDFNIFKLFLIQSQIEDIRNVKSFDKMLVFDRINRNTNLFESKFTALANLTQDKIIYKLVYLPGKQGELNEGKTKIFKKLAKNLKLSLTVVDYKNLSSLQSRINYATSIIQEQKEQLILCGSSMGGYISIQLSSQFKTICGMLLLAPAIGIQGYPNKNAVLNCKNIKVIHAYGDEIVPYENVVNFCTKNKIELHLVNDNHRLINSYKLIEQELTSLILKLYE